MQTRRSKVGPPLAMPLARALIVVLALLFVGVEPTSACPDYPTGQDAWAPIEAALAEAQGSNRRTLLLFGANWCPYCKSLCETFEKPEIAAALARWYVLVKIDVGPGFMNAGVQRHAGVFGDPFPNLVVLSRSGEILHRQQTGSWQTAPDVASHVPERIMAFLEEWQPPEDP